MLIITNEEALWFNPSNFSFSNTYNKHDHLYLYKTFFLTFDCLFCAFFSGNLENKFYNIYLFLFVKAMRC